MRNVQRNNRGLKQGRRHKLDDIKNMLQVIAIYGGDDRYEWEQTAGKYPSNWTIAIGTDSAIDCDGLYPVMEYPAMYMLDNNGTVLLKEATLPQIMRAL